MQVVTIHYETDAWLVVEKPPGMLVHRSKPSHTGTLHDVLCEMLAFETHTGGQVSLINRLDRETSGLVLVAKSNAAARELGKLMMARKLGKSYFAWLRGAWVGDPVRLIDAPLLRAGSVGSSPVWLRQMVHPDGAASQTRFRFRACARHATLGEITLVEAEPLTGRTHQIRVHAASMGLPVLGDKLYPDAVPYLDFIREGPYAPSVIALGHWRQALHSAMISIPEATGGNAIIHSALPPDLAGPEDFSSSPPKLFPPSLL